MFQGLGHAQPQALLFMGQPQFRPQGRRNLLGRQVHRRRQGVAGPQGTGQQFHGIGHLLFDEPGFAALAVAQIEKGQAATPETQGQLQQQTAEIPADKNPDAGAKDDDIDEAGQTGVDVRLKESSLKIAEAFPV